MGSPISFGTTLPVMPQCCHQQQVHASRLSMQGMPVGMSCVEFVVSGKAAGAGAEA
jgi:hypothetical protein